MTVSKNRFENENTAPNKIALMLALSLLLGACFVGPAVAQTKTCECEFSTNEYEAYGTNGACGVFMYNKGKTCEFSFAGAGANTEIMRAELGDVGLQNQFEIVPQIFEQYLEYIKKGEKGLFLDPGFIENSLVVMARAALFRKSSLNADLPLRVIDEVFTQFSEKNSRRIAETFQGSGRPFKDEPVKGFVFFVGQGYVELIFQQNAKVRIVYFSEHWR